MKSSEVSGQLYDQLVFRAERQKVISSNIANINTPNYKTKDLVFEEALDNSKILKLKRTTNDHMHNLEFMRDSNMRVVQIPGLVEQNDGNNVNLDSQMSEQSKNKILFDGIQAVIKRNSGLMRAVLDSSSKN